MSSKKLNPILWASTVVLLLGILFARAIAPLMTWIPIALAAALLGVFVWLIIENRNALRTRTAAYTLNSAITVLLVIGILGVLNFLAERYPHKFDLTKNQVHTFSEQSRKLVRELQVPVRAVHFARVQEREAAKQLLDNYARLNPKFEVEWVNLDKEVARARAAGIRVAGTVQLIVGTDGKEAKVENPSEETITNTLIKLLKDKTQTLCTTQGHGERDFNATDGEGMDVVRKALVSQSYEVKTIDLIAETKTEGKGLSACDALAVVGPTKSFFPAEIKLIEQFLDQGGRAVIALDMNIKGAEAAPELIALLKQWYVKASNALIVDPVSQQLGMDAVVPIVAEFSRDHAATRDFARNQAFFPFARPLEVMDGAPAGLNVQWLGRTTPAAWGEVNLKELATGRVEMNKGADIPGPLTTVVAAEGKKKDSTASRNTRLVVFGSSSFATNQYQRFGFNMDLFVNTVSWTLEDESLISIRTKEDEPGQVNLTGAYRGVIQIITVIVVPLLIAIAGIVTWVVRRRL